MTETVGGLPLLEIRIDEDGDVDGAGERDLRAALTRLDPTDLVVFGHGWNNTPAIARSLYRAFFGRLAPLARRHATDRKLALLGVFWPSIRWSDEPIPDFDETPDLRTRGEGAARLDAGASEGFVAPARPGVDVVAGLRETFEDQTPVLDELLTLLETRPDSREAVARARELLGLLAAGTSRGGDGEESESQPLVARPDPQAELFDAFALAMEEQGVVLDDGAGGGESGLGERLGRLWDGGQEVLRQLTYWKMKSRAGKVGERGLGPLLSRLLDDHPDLGLHLVGHSFGARAMSYALRPLPAQVGGHPPVRGVTLLQGAFSHYTFAASLPFDAARSGALRGQEAKVSGPVVACYSEHDLAVGVFYPLASMLAREDAAGISERMFRWGGIGRNGHQPGVREIALRDPGDAYDFRGARLVNIDAAGVVRRGVPPAGAHTDIVHDELAWVVLNAGALTS